MRIGNNPSKFAEADTSDAYHRIIIPVYIPNLEGYYENSLKVLKLCIKSLQKTVHNRTRISIVSNGSCHQVLDYLAGLYKSGEIDELIVRKTSIGKINAIYRALNGISEPLVTLTDADVLFTNGWQEEMETIHTAYPKTGMVSPFPYSKGIRELTANAIFDGLLKGNLTLGSVENPEAVDHFSNSIGNPGFYKNIHKTKCVCYQEGSKPKIILGAAHFVATFKTGVFDFYKMRKNVRKIGDGERKFIDKPSVEKGLWRVSSLRSYVYHMGNTVLPMYEESLSDRIKWNGLNGIPKFTIYSEPSWKYYLKNKLFQKIIYSRKGFSFLLRNLGLTSKEIQEYIK